MASEYFSTFQYICLNIVFFVFSLFLFAVCLYVCLFVRWVYKRRLRQKTDEMIEAYKGEEEKRKEIELNLKKRELDHPEKKKKGTTKHRNIHIVTKPCNHIIQKNSRELIVQQENENIPNDEVSCEPVGQPQQFQQSMNQMVNPQNIHTMDEFQQQFVLVPDEMLKKGGRVREARSSGLHPERHEVESVETQTSDRSDDESQKGPEHSDDWLAKYDERDAERIDVFDEQESENFKNLKISNNLKKNEKFYSHLRAKYSNGDEMCKGCTFKIAEKSQKTKTKRVTIFDAEDTYHEDCFIKRLNARKMEKKGNERLEWIHPVDIEPEHFLRIDKSIKDYNKPTIVDISQLKLEVAPYNRNKIKSKCETCRQGIEYGECRVNLGKTFAHLACFLSKFQQVEGFLDECLEQLRNLSPHYAAKAQQDVFNHRN